MKKLLLLSLLVAGANSFGAVIGESPITAGNSGVVALPIRSTARVLEATGKTLVIESKTAGMNGNFMEFAFGDIQASKAFTKSLDGSFEVKLADDTAFTEEATSATGESDIALAVGFDTTKFDKEISTEGDGANGLPVGMSINYAITGNLNDAKTKYIGNVNAILNMESSMSTPGSYSDNTQKIYAKLTLGASA